MQGKRYGTTTRKSQERIKIYFLTASLTNVMFATYVQNSVHSNTCMPALKEPGMSCTLASAGIFVPTNKINKQKL